MSDRTLGINYLRLWWNATPMASLQLTTFQDAIAYYDGKNPDFIAKLGQMGAHIDEAKISTALQNLAQQQRDKYPDWTEILQALVTASGTVTAGELAAAAGEGVLQAGKYITAGLGIYLAIALVAAIVVLGPELKTMLKDARG